MNAAKLKSSDRLKRVDRALSDYREHSTRALIMLTGMCAINSIVSELRRNGRKISCQRKGNAWYYKRARA